MNKTDLQQFEKVLDKKLDQKLKPVYRKLDALTADVVSIQQETKIIKDIHENTKDTRQKVQDLEARVEVLESAV